MARLVLNGGSSSWKCGAYDVAADARAIDAKSPLAEVRVSWSAGDDAEIETISTDGSRGARHAKVPHDKAIPAILDELVDAGVDIERVEAIGHRIVHGANKFERTTWIDVAVTSTLRTLEPFAPSHNPIELAAVAAVRTRCPNVPQYAVFDTQFHRTLGPAAYVYPGPYDWLAKDIRRYGFHGSSVAYATERTAAMLGRDVADTQIVVAHLGSGCSVTAVMGGKSVDTSMGFTPLDGTMMSTRSGSVDPAILIYLMREAAKTPDGGVEGALRDFAADLDHKLNSESGLGGISGISGDVREVRAAAEKGSERAKLALELFTHRLAATIAGLLPSLDRLDALVFTGGIGENDAVMRANTCAKLAFAGLGIDAAVNEAKPADAAISAADARTQILVISAREEWYIAREGARLSR